MCFLPSNIHIHGCKHKHMLCVYTIQSGYDGAKKENPVDIDVKSGIKRRMSIAGGVEDVSKMPWFVGNVSFWSFGYLVIRLFNFFVIFLCFSLSRVVCSCPKCCHKWLHACN